jgi:hypothetical protein
MVSEAEQANKVYGLMFPWRSQDEFYILGDDALQAAEIAADVLNEPVTSISLIPPSRYSEISY